MKPADEIRAHVLNNIIEPARQERRRTVVIKAGDVHTALGYEQRMPAVCGALDAEKFLDYAKVRLIRRTGPHQGSTAEWTFALD